MSSPSVWTGSIEAYLKIYRKRDMGDVALGLWDRAQRAAKHRYVCLEGTRAERREMLAALRERCPPLPYPKRPG